MKTLLLILSVLFVVGCASEYPRTDTACVDLAHKLNERNNKQVMSESRIQHLCTENDPAYASDDGNTGNRRLIVPWMLVDRPKQ